MPKKPQFNESGNVVAVLPYSGTQVELRRPKVRDIKVFEATAKKPDADNMDMLVTAIVTLQVSPSISLDEVLDLDAEDMEAYGEALSTIDFFAKMGKRGESTTI